jgi:hypothetical protein
LCRHAATEFLDMHPELPISAGLPSPLYHFFVFSAKKIRMIFGSPDKGLDTDF